MKGVLSRAMRDMPTAVEQLKSAAALAAKAHGDDHVETIDVLRELADTYSEAGRFADAEATLAIASTRAQRNPAVGRRDVFAIDSDLAITAVQAGRYSGSIERLRSLIARCDVEFGASDEHCVVLVNYLDAPGAAASTDRDRRQRGISLATGGQQQPDRRDPGRRWTAVGSAGAARAGRAKRRQRGAAAS
jgi:hypothetical protein